MFFQSTFMGASIRDFGSSIGWNGNPGQFQLQLVEDPRNGDLFSPPDIGTPAYFTFGGFDFFGLLQKWEKKNDVNGFPSYEVVLSDPTQVLEAAQVIIGNYTGGVGTVRNMFNAYGYWEATGFGNSLQNDTGMPWVRIRDAIVAMGNLPVFGTYGGPLTYRGISYSLDLSELPSPPIYYRIGGTSVSLLEAIQQVCEDGGCDFFVELDGFTIRIRTVSRRTQPPLGTITTVTNTNTGNVVRSNSGLEARNETTSSFLVGGKVQTLYLTNAIQQFWGYDILGNPILGVPGVINFVDNRGRFLNGFDTEFMNLNASPVSDVVGNIVYTCSTLEMRLAQAGQEAWRAYILKHRVPIAAISGMTSPVANLGAGQALQLAPNLANDRRFQAVQLGIAAVQGDLHQKEQRLYEFVKGYADEYMGKQFVVGIPFVLSKTDAETLQVSTSYEISDGGFLPEGSAPLGLSLLNEDRFKQQDGRFAPFCKYGNLLDADLSNVSPQGTAVDNNELFMSVNLEPQILFTPAPAALMVVNGPLKDQVADGAVGDLDIVAAVLQMNPAQAERVIRNRQFGNVGVRIAPATRTPNFAAIPLKSNILTYGPWFAAGAPGRVKFESDESLTPWEYGGFEIMNLAGNARVADGITNMQVSESGSIELAGLPLISLGGTLAIGGPNATNVDVRFGTNGVTTSYRFQTYTPRFGVFSKGNVERMKRLGLTNQEFRRSLRNAVNENLANVEAIGGAIRANKAFLQNAPRAVNPNTPHTVFIGSNLRDLDESGIIRTGVSSATIEEAVGFSQADNDEDYAGVSTMSMNGLLRPFSTGLGGRDMSRLVLLPSVTGEVPNVNNLNPWKDPNDIEFYAYGQTYTGLNAFLRETEIEGFRPNQNARPMALRGPLVISGWGYDTEGQQVPLNWPSGYLKAPDTWKTGPVDLLWDERRGVWTCHDALKGYTSRETPAHGSVSVVVEPADTGARWQQTAHNWFNTAIPSGSRVIMNYIATDNKWFIVAADCTPETGVFP